MPYANNKHAEQPAHPRSLISAFQGGHWSGKSQGNLQIGQGNFKDQESQGILAQNICCSRYLDYLECEKSVDFLKVLIFSLARFARSKL